MILIILNILVNSVNYSGKISVDTHYNFTLYLIEVTAECYEMEYYELVLFRIQDLEIAKKIFNFNYEELDLR